MYFKKHFPIRYCDITSWAFKQNYKWVSYIFKVLRKHSWCKMPVTLLNFCNIAKDVQSYQQNKLFKVNNIETLGEDAKYVQR